MPQLLSFVPSTPHYEFDTTLDGRPCRFEVYWNALDGAGAWYFHLRTDAGALIAAGVKIVLGVPLGRRIEHPVTRAGVIVALDTSGQARDAGFDDLGTRVKIMYLTLAEWVAAAMRAATR